MKLWYQSMSRQAEWGGYPAVLRAILDKVKDPDTEIHVAGITQIGGVAPPPADQIETFREHYGQDIYPTVRAS